MDGGFGTFKTGKEGNSGPVVRGIRENINFFNSIISKTTKI